MKLKSIQMKITVLAGVCLLITSVIIVVYAVVIMRGNASNARDEAVNAAERYAVAKAKQYATSIQGALEIPLDTARTLAQTLSGIKSEDAWLELGRDEVNGILQTILEKNPEFVATYTCWEPDAFDEMDNGYKNFDGHDATGRFIPRWRRNEFGGSVLEPLVDYDKEGPGAYYLLPKNTKTETLLDPTISSVQGKETLVAALVVPVLAKDQFYGIFGIDLRLDSFQALVDNVQDLYEGTAQIALISHNGTLVAVTGKPELAGSHMKSIQEDFEEDLQNIQDGEEVVKIVDNQLAVFTPLKTGHTMTPWSVSVAIPMEKITAEADKQMRQALYNLWKMIGIGVICAAGALGLLWVTSRTITKPLNKAVEISNRIAKGELPQNIQVTSQDETGQLLAAMKQMTEKIREVLKETKNQSQAVQDGKLDIRVNAEAFAGGWRQLVVGVNNVIDAFVAPINMTAEYIDRISKGNIPEKISDEYKGDFNEIKYNLNMLIDAMNETTRVTEEIAGGNLLVDVKERSEHDRLMKALNRMIKELNTILSETDMLIQSVQEGKLDTRGNAEAFAGSWRELVIGVNSVIDAFVKPIAMTAQSLDRISKGDIPKKIAEEYKGDFNTMKNHLNLLIESTNEVTRLAQEIAEGNLRVNVEQRSERDELMKALGKMVMYIQEVADVTEKISNKDLQVDVTPKSDQDVLNKSLQKMVTNLQAMVEEIERSMTEVQQQNWLRTGQAELSNTMRGEQEFITLAKNIITYLANYLQAQVGTIYLTDGDDSLRLVGSYAYTTRKGNRNTMKFGEGLIGQAALEKQGILFTNVPDDYIVVSSSLGETIPRNILVAPFIYEGDVKGVVELGTTGDFTTIQREFLEQVAENVAIAFHSTQTREKMQELLEASQQQAEELQAQQENLREANEKLESQTKNLRESEQKLQEQQEELRQTNEELEAQTKALEQQQQALREKNLDLEKAQRLVEEKAKDLEISNKYKSEFLANMSHELRTPLNSLLILSKLLSENKGENLTEKQVEFANTIHSAGSDLLVLINEVLDLSKIEAGKMVLNIEKMSMNGLAKYINQHFGHVAEERGLELNIKQTEGLPACIHTDRQRVEQIVKNLLSNAMKFTVKGGVTVEMKRPADNADLSRSGLVPQYAIAISVSDTGPGIPEDKQKLIFEAFQQADGTTSRKYGGTGLGLSIARELTKLLGGEIHVYSKEGEGSTFTLYLPEVLKKTQQMIPHAETKQEANVAPAFTESTKSVEQRKGAAIKPTGIETIRDDRHEVAAPEDKFLLIVEDDPKFAKILFELAREKGFKGLIAGDGAAGLQLAYQYIPDAIILDVGLPGMNGWRVMEKLKQNPDTRHIPVHFISASDQPLDAMKMGAIGYLTKPVSIDELHDAFHTIEAAIAKTIKKLLVVEDDESTRTSMLALLSGDDVTITTAETGEDAQKLLNAEVFDCMVLDLGLKDISGLDLLEKIKDEAITSHIPVIIYTAKDLTKDEEMQLKKHAESIILKGVSSQERLLDEVTLFLHRVEANLPEAQQKKLKMIHDKEAVLNGKTVLMVDDDMRNVFALTSVLEEKGMGLSIAENGKEALKLLDEHPDIDLVLMDIMMPEMDGYETMREIRKQQKFKDLPIIALTAKAMKGDRQRCIDAGANDYLSKPVDTEKLLSLLRVWLY